MLFGGAKFIEDQIKPGESGGVWSIVLLVWPTLGRDFNIVHMKRPLNTRGAHSHDIGPCKFRPPWNRAQEHVTIEI